MAATNLESWSPRWMPVVSKNACEVKNIHLDYPTERRHSHQIIDWHANTLGLKNGDNING